MYKTFLCTFVVFAVVYFQESNAIQCYLCIGSSTSDCAANNIAAMGVQNCPPINITFPHHHHRHHHHRRHHHHHGDEDFETTTNLDGVVGNNIDVTERPDFAEEDFTEELSQDKFSTTENPHERHHRRLELEASCVYAKTKASNGTTAIVARGCGYMPPKKDYCEVMKKYNKYLVECKTCTTDKCN